MDGKALFCVEEEWRGGVRALYFCFIGGRALTNFFILSFNFLEKFYFKLWGKTCPVLKSFSHLPTVISSFRRLEISKNSKHIWHPPPIFLLARDVLFSEP